MSQRGACPGCHTALLGLSQTLLGLSHGPAGAGAAGGAGAVMTACRAVIAGRAGAVMAACRAVTAGRAGAVMAACRAVIAGRAGAVMAACRAVTAGRAGAVMAACRAVIARGSVVSRRICLQSSRRPSEPGLQLTQWRLRSVRQSAFATTESREEVSKDAVLQFMLQKETLVGRLFIDTLDMEHK